MDPLGIDASGCNNPCRGHPQDARLRFDSLRQALETSPNTQLEREVHRVFAKLSESWRDLAF